MTVRYVTLSELIYINGTVLDHPAIREGRQQIRDIALLDAAVARPAQSAFGEDAFPDLAQKAAVLLHGIARNHPFADGNKRTATVGALFMLRVNGHEVRWDQPEALTMILRTAEGRCGLEELAAWLPLSPLPRDSTPEAESDMRLIDEIIAAQKWLLDALERQ
ncbi:MAG: type II toxin-antitoxin system death-on-curing family toxin [Chloroflexi bacterium]|nr:type II toxin-antitoxin system death-on-curing family toxin [Chloroflexota bacterium]